jgi:hypothetical protein
VKRENRRKPVSSVLRDVIIENIYNLMIFQNRPERSSEKRWKHETPREGLQWKSRACMKKKNIS